MLFVKLPLLLHLHSLVLLLLGLTIHNELTRCRHSGLARCHHLLHRFYRAHHSCLLRVVEQVYSILALADYLDDSLLGVSVELSEALDHLAPLDDLAYCIRCQQHLKSVSICTHLACLGLVRVNDPKDTLVLQFVRAVVNQLCT